MKIFIQSTLTLLLVLILSSNANYDQILGNYMRNYANGLPGAQMPIGYNGVMNPTGYSDVTSMFGCFCVPLHLCTDNDAAVNGAGLLDLRKKQNLCKNYFEVCCDFPITDYAPPSYLPPPSLLPPPGYLPEALPPVDPGHLMDPTHQEHQTNVARSCGYQTPVQADPLSSANSGDGMPRYRITGTKMEAAFGELPWTVVILYKESKDAVRSLYKCGGSLIHEQVVLTAAHCLSNTPMSGLSSPAEGAHWTIRAGEWNTNNQEEVLPHQDKVVGELIVHAHYHASSLKNDIALLVLKEPVTLTDNVGLACLPPFGLSMDGIRCTASGWGKNAFKKGRHSAIMRKVELPIVEKNKCLAALRNTRLGAFYQLHHSFICAGGEGDKDTCKGDGGSPLMCPLPNQPDRFVQMGIVSWGIGCGDAQTPGVYVNVGLYRNWIDNELSERGMDTSSYRYED